MDTTVEETQGYILNRINELDKKISFYENRLKKTPDDKDIAEMIMTLQVAREEFKQDLSAISNVSDIK